MVTSKSPRLTRSLFSAGPPGTGAHHKRTGKTCDGQAQREPSKTCEQKRKTAGRVGRKETAQTSALNENAQNTNGLILNKLDANPTCPRHIGSAAPIGGPLVCVCVGLEVVVVLMMIVQLGRMILHPWFACLTPNLLQC